MTDPTRPATGIPAQAQPTNGYPPPQPAPFQTQQSNYYYPNHNPYHHAPPPPQNYYPSPRATFFRRFMAGIIASFIILGAILFIVWLILRPRVPIFTVQSLSLSSLNLNSSQISAAWDIRFTVTNPNSKLHVYYDEIEARISYKSSLLAQNELQPFDQGTESETQLSAKLVATSAYISPDLGRKMSDDRANGGGVKFNVQVLSLVRFKSGGWRARKRFLRVFCDDLFVGVTAKGSNGTLTGGPHRCAVVI